MIAWEKAWLTSIKLVTPCGAMLHWAKTSANFVPIPRKYIMQPSSHQSFFETGRRVSEVSFLKFDCLEQDSDDDWLLRVNEKKLKRERLIPISNACVETIKAQQNDLR